MNVPHQYVLMAEIQMRGEIAARCQPREVGLYLLQFDREIKTDAYLQNVRAQRAKELYLRDVQNRGRKVHAEYRSVSVQKKRNLDGPLSDIGAVVILIGGPLTLLMLILACFTLDVTYMYRAGAFLLLTLVGFGIFILGMQIEE